MSEWNPHYSEVEDIEPFVNVAEQRGYTVGENADEMAVGSYEGQNTFLESMSPEDAIYDVFADILSDQLENFNLRVPSAYYDSEAVLEEIGAVNEGVLITEELGEPTDNGVKSKEERADSLVDSCAFEFLLGQGDIRENISTDSKGVFIYDFSETGKDGRGIYDAIKSEAEELAEEMKISQEIDSYNDIGRRASDMASEIDEYQVFSELEERLNVSMDREAQRNIFGNTTRAKFVGKGADPKNLFNSTSMETDSGVEKIE